ncbi:hypothetical protein KFX46_07980 [Macrococcus canis]|uniref:hypothetical protein n=1 Tax=Macrococcoides canis TaxID=1855823 RepID=UPI00207CB280|nr:hypothetical protein [Macrococcus canis]MCO4096944.1 hypothetical protein [Macrococcus canis]
MMETIDATMLMVTILVLTCGLVPALLAANLIIKLLFKDSLEWIDRKRIIKDSILFILSATLLISVLYIVNTVQLTPGVLKDIKDEEAIKMLLIITDYNKLLFSFLIVGSCTGIFLYSVVNLIRTVLRVINQRNDRLVNVLVKSLYEKDHSRIVSSYMDLKKSDTKLKLNKQNTIRLIEALLIEKRDEEALYLLRKLEKFKDSLVV